MFRLVQEYISYKKNTLNSQMFLTLLNNIIPVSYDIGVQFVAFKHYHQFVM